MRGFHLLDWPPAPRTTHHTVTQSLLLAAPASPYHRASGYIFITQLSERQDQQSFYPPHLPDPIFPLEDGRGMEEGKAHILWTYLVEVDSAGLMTHVLAASRCSPVIPHFAINRAIAIRPELKESSLSVRDKSSRNAYFQSTCGHRTSSCYHSNSSYTSKTQHRSSCDF